MPFPDFKLRPAGFDVLKVHAAFRNAKSRFGLLHLVIDEALLELQP